MQQQQIPTRSPWGKVQHAFVLAPGVVEVSCAGHGGLKLDRQRNKLVPKEARRAGGWYEEDCEYWIAILALGLYNEARTPEAARAAVRDYFPDAFTAITGEAVAEHESLVLRERAAWAARLAKGAT